MSYVRRMMLAGALLSVLAIPAAPAMASPRLKPAPGSPFSAPAAFALAFSPDGQFLAVTERGATPQVQIFAVRHNGTLTPVAAAPVGQNPDSLAFSPDGNYLAVADEGDGQLWIFKIDSSGGLSPVAGSPFQVGHNLTSVAYSPNGQLLAVAEAVQDPTTPSTVAVFSVAPDGTLSSSPVGSATTGYEPDSVAFSPSGQSLVVANFGDRSLSVFSVGSDGSLTPASGSPFSTGSYGPRAVAFSPNGALLAGAFSAVPCCSTNGAVGMYSVGSSPALAPVPGSPFPAGNDPEGVAFSRDGTLLAATNTLDSTLSLFSVGANGQLTAVAGSPFATGHDPHSVAFSPNGRFVAVTNIGDGTVSVFRLHHHGRHAHQ